MDTSPVEISAIIRNIIYSDTNTGFYIFSFEDKRESGFLKKAKGSFAMDKPFPGQEVTLSGKWEKTKYGPTLKVTSFDPIPVVGSTGIEKFLTSYVEGIGPVNARKIVGHFKEQTLSILENEPERIFEIPDIRQDRAEAIIEEWKNFSEFRDIAITLMDFSMSAAQVKKAYEKWGKDTLEKIQDNPYCLTQISGIGFMKADSVAVSLGIPIDSPTRIAGCIEYALEKATSLGHTFLLLPEIVGHVHNLFRSHNITSFGRALEQEDIKQALQLLLKEEVITLEGQRMYPKRLHYYEEMTAEYLAELNSSETSVFEHFDLDQAVSDYEESRQITFSDQQREAILSLRDNKVTIITGLPGTGKTFCTQAIVDIFKKVKISFTMMSPTGIAAKRLSTVTQEAASTIHRGLGFGPAGNGMAWAFNHESRLPYDAVIIDEVSMLDLHLAYRLFSALRDSCIVVLVGDHAQLPSVGAGNVLHDLIKSKKVGCVQLTQIYRQEEASDIIINAHRITSGEAPILREDKDRDFHFIRKDSKGEILESILRLVGSMHEKNLNYQVMSPRWKGDLGVNALNTAVRDIVNPPGSQRDIKLGHLTLREGDKIVITQNNYEIGVFNGEIGFLHAINSKESLIEIRIPDEGGDLDKYVKIPYHSVLDHVNLAFCTTFHKFQGSQADYIIFPYVKGFYHQLQRNLLYTAVTRAAKKVFIFGHWDAIIKSVKNDEVSQRNSFLNERIIQYYEGLEA